MSKITLPITFISFGSALFFSTLASASSVDALPTAVKTSPQIILGFDILEVEQIKLAQQTETAAQKAQRERDERRAERERKRAERAAKRKKRSSKPRFGSFF